jgi:hypothetical protein
MTPDVILFALFSFALAVAVGSVIVAAIELFRSRNM